MQKQAMNFLNKVNMHLLLNSTERRPTTILGNFVVAFY